MHWLQLIFRDIPQRPGISHQIPDLSRRLLSEYLTPSHKRQVFTFPAGTRLSAGQSVRVYTNEVHPETGGFSFGSAMAIWNDHDDVATLFNAAGESVSTFAYNNP